MFCEYCNKELSSKLSLSYHQKNTKYCLEIQNKSEKIEENKCNFCDKIVSSKANLKRHLLKCKLKIHQENIEYIKQTEEQIKENDKKIKEEADLKVKEIQIEKDKYLAKIEFLERERIENLKKYEKEKIEELKQQVQDWKDHAQNITNNVTSKAIEKPTNINNIQKITDNSIKKIDKKILNLAPITDLKNGTIGYTFGEHYNKNHLMKGIKGLASFCHQYLLKTPDNKLRMMCTDPNRNVYTYIDDQGNIHKDIGAENFIQMISDPAKIRSDRVFLEIESDYNLLLEEAEEDYVDPVTLNIEKQRIEHAANKKFEIANLEDHKNEFLKNLGPPLYSESQSGSSSSILPKIL